MKSSEMTAQLFVPIVVEAFYGSFLDGAIHVFHLSVRQWMVVSRQFLLDAVIAAPHVEHLGHVSSGWPVGMTRRLSKVNAIIR